MHLSPLRLDTSESNFMFFCRCPAIAIKRLGLFPVSRIQLGQCAELLDGIRNRTVISVEHFANSLKGAAFSSEQSTADKPRPTHCRLTALALQFPLL